MSQEETEKLNELVEKEYRHHEKHDDDESSMPAEVTKVY